MLLYPTATLATTWRRGAASRNSWSTRSVSSVTAASAVGELFVAHVGRDRVVAVPRPDLSRRSQDLEPGVGDPAGDDDPAHAAPDPCRELAEPFVDVVDRDARVGESDVVLGLARLGRPEVVPGAERHAGVVQGSGRELG